MSTARLSDRGFFQAMAGDGRPLLLFAGLYLLFGGLFVNRAQALKYALFANGNHLETIVELPPGIELDINGTISQASSPTRLA